MWRPSQEKRETPIRCPKCKGGTLELGYTLEEDWSADVVEGELVFRGCASIPSITSAHGKCKCGHTWKVRDLSKLSTL